jgi:hypothetical protein
MWLWMLSMAAFLAATLAAGFETLHILSIS